MRRLIGWGDWVRIFPPGSEIWMVAWVVFRDRVWVREE